MPFSFTFHRAQRLLRTGSDLYKRKIHRLDEIEKKRFELLLIKLKTALKRKDKEELSIASFEVDRFIKTHFKKSAWDHLKELVFALAFAIIVAFAIRQFWFELYEVPTGSMRPTIKELDRLLVSKTTFGINPPFKNTLWLYSPSYVKRGGIIIFTVEDMDVADARTTYFYLFPGIKRYVKRCMGKPGDTLYFYGGRIYGVDNEGKPITELADEERLRSLGIDRIDHVPTISFDGKTTLSSPLSQGAYAQTLLQQMNLPIGKLQLKNEGRTEGQFFDGKQWIKDRPDALKTRHETPMSYSDLWGIGNYAMARLLTADEVKKLYGEAPKEVAPLYLELRHTPNLTYPQPEMRRDETGQVHLTITPFLTLLPLNASHLSELQKALYTSRFYIQDGHAFRYHEGRHRIQRPEFDPLFPRVPDGCYEFYYGKGYKVHWGGIVTSLPENHPLYASTPEMIQKLFNLGIGFNTIYRPVNLYSPFLPQRYAYYRDGDLYVMGAPILKKDDPTLTAFVAKETEKQNASSNGEPYIAFIDRGPPIKPDGQIDSDFIRAFGLEIPENGVLALGDNYAMSADSRDFGFAPVSNLRGSPTLTFWPPGSRLGSLPQPSYPWLTLPNILIWIIVILITAICIYFVRKRRKRPLPFEYDDKNNER